MSFTKLPNEIIYHILREAVHVRGTKRAQRLRFVSRAWKAAVDVANIQLGEFVKSTPGYDRAPFWQEYTLRAALHLGPRLGPEELSRGKREPKTLRLIREAAERIARYAHPDTYSEDLLDGYIVEITKMGQNLRKDSYVGGPPGDSWSMLSSFGNKERRYYRLLLAAAAWTNQVGLVKELVQSWPLVPDDPGLSSFIPYIILFALGRAGYRGHNETIRVLLDALEDHGRASALHGKRSLISERLEGKAKETILLYASRGNKLSTIEMFVRPDKAGKELADAVFETTSLDIFQTLYPWAKNYFDINTTDWYDSHTSELLIRSVARRGVVPILDYLFRQLYPDSVSWGADSPPPTRLEVCSILGTAARNGHEEAVIYLMGKGFRVSADVLEAAVEYGNRAIVQLLLERAPPVESTYALTVAVEKEDEKLLEMLLDACAGPVDIEYKGSVVGHSRDSGLESMEKLLLERWEK
ncbi:hypothetical protein PG985_009911 [Apiospora marii]|uniref:uncharacterized protein n=1 Tax=Apiospora marii TaxID=335849 RepID=UPI00312EEC9D